ncbi:MAG: translin family protein [Thermoplasmata archaeon]
MAILGPTRRRELEDILREMERDLEEKDAIRELALKSSRAVARLSVSAVGSLHREKAVAPYLDEAREEASKLRSLLKEHPDLYFSGFVENAHQDMTEAAVAFSLVRNAPLPRPQDLGVTNRAYLLGLGDVVGELRRHALERLGKGDVEAAREALEAMEILYEGLMRFDYPRAVAAVKRKQDIARSLVEKTRGEVAVALRTRDLERKLEKRFGEGD